MAASIRASARRTTSLSVLAVLFIAAGFLELTSASAQFLGAPARRMPASSSAIGLGAKRDPNAQMLVRANVLDYDYTNERVSAVGHVQIYYSGSTLEADKVIYDQKAKRLYAEGNVRLVEADGRILYATSLELSDDYRDGFVDSLRLDSPDKTRIAAARAERSGGNITVFQSGVYTACEPCKDDPRKPPLWQIKATRIIHDQTEKMIYYEGASLEFFGTPLAYLPYFSAPDPTVKRKTGFLFPTITWNSNYGVGVTIPYYWAIAPDYDLTLTPTLTSRQGLLMQAEWRQRLIDGAYSVRAAGIFQADKEHFLASEGPSGFGSGYRDFRGSLHSTGQFSITDRWVWGWDGTVVTDKPFLQDYSVIKIPPEIVSQLYLSGRGDRSYFDARAIHYLGLSAYDRQQELPIIHPVIDYFYVFGRPVFGGELGYNINLTSLSRSSADFDPITQTAANSGWCEPTADPAMKTRLNCVLRGAPGTYSRVSGELHWRRSIVDPFGQVFSPFVSVRADAAQVHVQSEPAVANFITPGDNSEFRAMPAVGLEYRYPFMSVHSWGTQIIEPMAQVIARPNEPSIGKFPNEDSQSLVFSDANLLALDRFAGWDRVEGGTRANVGVQYSSHFNGGGYVNMLVGQSYQLAGTNSYAVPDTANTGLDSGLETRRSDYVARLMVQPNSVYSFISRFRFDEESFDVRRLELEGRATFERWSVSMLYGNYDAEPDIGFLTRRQGVLGSASLKLTQNWTLLGSLRYDVEAERVNQRSVGIGYIDDCFGLNLTYVTDYGYTLSPQPIHSVMLQVSLRTLGSTRVVQKIDGLFESSTVPGYLNVH
jgi:LPS-assembly protein